MFGSAQKNRKIARERSGVLGNSECQRGLCIDMLKMLPSIPLLGIGGVHKIKLKSRLWWSAKVHLVWRIGCYGNIAKRLIFFRKAVCLRTVCLCSGWVGGNLGMAVG